MNIKVGAIILVGSFLMAYSASSGQEAVKGSGTAATAMDKAAVGKAAWEESSCSGCHGTRGQGGSSADLPAGPNLRRPELTRQRLVEATSCGVPGTQMASWRSGAYTELPCFGKPLGEPPADVAVIGSLSQAQIESVIDYVQNDLAN